MKNPIYLDYNATTPLDPAVAEAMLPFIHQIFGNPSSSHTFGISARQAVEKARKQLAGLLGCQIDEVIFTSGGSESNNYAIKGAAFANRSKGNHIITSQIEHPAVTEVCQYLEERGFQTTYLPVDSDGLIDPAEVEKAITPHTILITIMHANNEVGTIQPIKEIVRLAHKKEILVHTDAAQSLGKIPVRVDELEVDLLSIAGHKLYAPKGVGVLYIRRGVKLEKFMHGAGQEMNYRAGTENVIEAVGLGTACQLVSQNLPTYQSHLQKMRDLLEQKLKEEFPEARVNGHPQRRLPNTLSISFPGLEANTILSQLTLVAASAGAACHSDRVDVSHVLSAMKVPLEYAMGTIRFSTGRSTSIQEIEQAVEEISAVIHQLRPKAAAETIYPDAQEIKLTQYTHGLGCACKLRPQVLEQVLKRLPGPADEKVLVGIETSDDASVYLIDSKTAILQTVDFFTPVVDDPFHFGAIAAANSLSDIYAMGGQPLFALNIVGFPSNRLPVSVLEKILAGAQSKAAEAGISIIGGHTVDDTEPKFGLAVTGIAAPEKILRNSTAKSGDALILTKPLGTGILSTALKRGMLDKSLHSLLINTMSLLNKSAAEVMQDFPVHACTDVTGFGLLGHLLEMMNGSGTSAILNFESIPFLPEVLTFLIGGILPGGTRDNFEFTRSSVQYAPSISENQQLLLNDAQTSGGLLISVSADKAEKMLERLQAVQLTEASIIGQVKSVNSFKIRVE
jgi:cysteine desulfurase